MANLTIVALGAVAGTIITVWHVLVIPQTLTTCSLSCRAIMARVPVLKAGAAGYVLKSTVDTELLDAIRVVAKGGAFLYPSATRMLLEDYLGHLQATTADAYGTLSEREVLKLIALGFTAAQVAEKLSLSAKTVETYRTRIMEKSGHRASLANAACISWATTTSVCSRPAMAPGKPGRAD